MVFRSRRKISSKTAKKMLTLSHYTFKTWLMNKAREYPNCRVIICDEEYTSQTCSECGYLSLQDERLKEVQMSRMSLRIW
jgi:putative transposase